MNRLPELRLRTLMVVFATLELACHADLPAGWSWRSPLPQGHTLFDVAAGAGKFVAVGEFGTIVSSTNGKNWRIEKSGSTADLFRVIYANGSFVAVGENGSILTSTDAQVWTARLHGVQDRVYDVAFGNGVFVAVGGATDDHSNAGRQFVVTSADGINWSRQDTGQRCPRVATGSSDGLKAVAFGNGRFVALSCANCVLTSTKGVVWNSQDLTGVPQDVSYDVTFGESRFVLVGHSQVSIITSTDGVHWAVASENQPHALSRVAVANGRYVAMAGVSPHPHYGQASTILVSANAMTWTSVEIDSEWNFYGVASMAGVTVLVGAGGEIVLSDDMANWEHVTSREIPHSAAILYAAGLFVSVGLHGTVLTSPDGHAWTRRESGTTNHLGAVVHQDGFLAVGEKGTILRSNDGLSWASVNSGTDRGLFDVIWAGDRFIAVGPYQVLTSRDGVSWEKEAAPPLWPSNLCFGNGTTVIVGSDWGGVHGSGMIKASTNGQDWVPGIAPTGLPKLWSVLFLNGEFYASSFYELFASRDGVNWEPRNRPPWPERIARGSGLLAGVHGGDVLFSADGAHWTAQQVTARALTDIAYGDGSFIVLGSDATILQREAAVALLDSGRMTTRGFEARILGDNAGRYRLQVSDNLNSWFDLSDSIVETALIDTASGRETRFYRLISP